MRTREEQRERRIVREMNTCAHFNGIQHNKCAAGINIRELVAGPEFGWATRIPCILGDEVCTIECPSRKLPTREEAEKEVADSDASMNRTLSALRAAHDDAKAKGYGRGHGGRDSIPCPIKDCNGTLHYSVASVNGHMHGRCDSGTCVSWME